MKITPGFIAAAVVCAAPLALAVRDDLARREERRAAETGSLLGMFDRYEPAPEPSYPDEVAIDEPAPVVTGKQPVTADDLPQLVGPEPATTGPVLAGIVLGASSESFLPDDARERTEAYKTTRHVNFEFDYDFVSLNGITLRALGDGTGLRDGLLAAWGTPRRLGEDELVWLGAGGTRAVLHTMVDGIDLTFTPYLTVEALVAPGDKAKLGIEPFPLIGAKLVDVEDALGQRLQETSYSDDWFWAVPGVGAGSGKTTVRITVDPRTVEVIELAIEGSTAEGGEIRRALAAKWGEPKQGTDDDGRDALVWKRRGVTTRAYIDEYGFTITQRE